MDLDHYYKSCIQNLKIDSSSAERFKITAEISPKLKQDIYEKEISSYSDKSKLF